LRPYSPRNAKTRDFSQGAGGVIHVTSPNPWSASFMVRELSRAPEAIRLVYLCQFVVRALILSTVVFLGCRVADSGIKASLVLADRQSSKTDRLYYSVALLQPHKWCRNINLLSIDYAFRPHLRTRLTLGGFTFPRKPQTYGVLDFH